MRPERDPIVLAAVFTLSLMAGAATPTETSLTISPSSVAAGTTVVLTAAVTSSGAPVHPGTVVFCNAAAAYCEDSAILGSAQLTSAGLANLAVRLPPNTYSIKAIFQATPNSATPRASSTSAVNTLTVTGLSSSVTGPLVAVPNNGFFDLSTTVAGFGANPLTGSVTFQDSVQNGTPLTLAVDSITSAPGQTQFTAPGSVPLPPHGIGVTIGDVNNDGLPDFLVVNEYLYPNTDFSRPGMLNLVVLLNNGDGTYETITQYFPTISALGLTAGDFNGDGLLDIVMYDYISRTLTPMLGDGHGHFTALSAVPVMWEPSASGLLVADINGDGNLDVLSFSGLGLAEVFLGTGDGNLMPGPTISNVGYFAILKDVNGDGVPDIVTFDENTFIIETFLGNGDGTFTYKWISTPPITGYSMASADFNGDGIPDLLIADAYDYAGHILLGNGDGSFRTSYTFYSAYHYLGQVGTGDFNGDGIPDAFFYSDLGGSAVQVALGKGDGTLEPPYASIGQGLGYPNPVPVDINGDGLADLLFIDGPTNANLYLSEVTKPAATSGVALGDDLDHVITALYSGSTYFAPSSTTYDVITFPNVTNQLTFTSSGFLYSRLRQAYVGTITVTNVSAATIAGPLQVGFTGLPYKVALLNPMVNKNEGFFTAPAGLAPGQSVSFVVQFSNPNNVAISYTLIAYTGAF